VFCCPLPVNVGLDLERAGKPQQATYVAYTCSLCVVKMTAPLERVLRAFLEDPVAPRYGYDLMKAAGLKSGTLYPMLGRLEDDRLVTSAWETPQQDGQRPRKYYRLTGEGIRVARLELAQVSASRPRAPGRPARPARESLG
jgi:PadR family transcriptional regulator, regulatory protein PadR